MAVHHAQVCPDGLEQGYAWMNTDSNLELQTSARAALCCLRMGSIHAATLLEVLVSPGITARVLEDGAELFVHFAQGFDDACVRCLIFICDARDS